METDATNCLPSERRTPEDLAQFLVQLFGDRFGGASGGKFRISRKFLRQLAGRRRLPDGYLSALAEEMFETGFVLVDCESYFIVLSQRQFVSYRRVTALAVNRVMSHEEAKNGPKTEHSKESEQAGIQSTKENSPQGTAEIHRTNQ